LISGVAMRLFPDNGKETSSFVIPVNCFPQHHAMQSCNCVPAVRFPWRHADSSHEVLHNCPSKNYMPGVPIQAAVFPWNNSGVLKWVFDSSFPYLLAKNRLSQRTVIETISLAGPANGGLARFRTRRSMANI
jgi:hypothetical protein